MYRAARDPPTHDGAAPDRGRRWQWRARSGLTFESALSCTVSVMGYGISELARRSGFSPSTLRYYETEGLLPDPDRTEAGYRVYGDEAVERLAFIARAKTMGLALSDIAQLVRLWEDGSCAPTQARLRDLLDAKVTDVRSRLTQLSSFAAQLSHLRATLSTTQPTERCGPGCGCDVAMPASIACTLSPSDASDRLTEWAELLAHVSERRATENGLFLRLPPDPTIVAQAAELAVRESQCCSFFTFSMTVDATGTSLDVTAPPGGRAVLDALFGSGDS